MRIITMAMDCYHFLLYTNTKSRDCTVIVSIQSHRGEIQYPSLPPSNLFRMHHKETVSNLDFQKLSLSREAFCYPPAPFPATPNHDIATFKNEDTPLNTRY